MKITGKAYSGRIWWHFLLNGLPVPICHSDSLLNLLCVSSAVEMIHNGTVNVLNSSVIEVKWTPGDGLSRLQEFYMVVGFKLSYQAEFESKERTIIKIPADTQHLITNLGQTLTLSLFAILHHLATIHNAEGWQTTDRAIGLGRLSDSYVCRLSAFCVVYCGQMVQDRPIVL